jgi:ribonuclease HII
MHYLVGTDEAGYGPNLGPLVISATVWEAPDKVESGSLYGLLADTIATAPARRDPRVAIADSKTLYKPGKGLRLLEGGLWAAWSLLGREPCTCAEVWDLLADGSAGPRREALCDGCDGRSVPRDADRDALARLWPGLVASLAAAGVRLVAVRSRAVFPAEFNDTVARCESKGLALSRWTLDLVKRSIAPIGPSRISILCDKHGGRDRYLPLLLECFPDVFFQVGEEGRQRSAYRGGPPERRIEIAFQAKAESHLPTALASMASKYLRELAMEALNEFWAARVPGLTPTAGYPQDAPRFKRQIAEVQTRLDIADRIIWRVK